MNDRYASGLFHTNSREVAEYTKSLMEKQRMLVASMKPSAYIGHDYDALQLTTSAFPS